MRIFRLLICLALTAALLPKTLRADVTFTKVISGGIAPSRNATGAAWGDFNHDGLIDLFVSVYPGSDVLYTNNGNGNFAVDSSAGIGAGAASSWGCAWGDYDNDGNLDILGSVYGGDNFVLHNNGNGVFTKLAGIPVGIGSGNDVVWGDYDNDGFIDAFCAASSPCLFHNDGHGGFVPITNMVAAADVSGQGGCSWGDYDNDGYLDLIVSRVNQPNLLYHNNRDGTFTKITNAPFATDVSISQGCSWGDYDNDGYLDLLVCNVGATNFLYHNNGDGTFTRTTNGPISTVVANSSGGAWADYDNDGFLDLFIAVRGGTNLLFHNNGDGTFTQVTNVAPVNLSGAWISGAWGDFNNHGFPDLFVANEAGLNALYVNSGNANNWINIQCLGRVSNRAAIGAKVRVKSTISGKIMWQLREISGGGSLASQNDLRAEFGLGDATNIDIVRIEWPSGIVQQFTNVAAKQFLTVKEPSKLSADFQPATDELHVTVTGGKGLLYSLENSTDLTNWIPIATLTNQTGAVTWTNQSSLTNLFFRAEEL